jgi:hypothetical protein
MDLALLLSKLRLRHQQQLLEIRLVAPHSN